MLDNKRDSGRESESIALGIYLWWNDRMKPQYHIYGGVITCLFQIFPSFPWNTFVSNFSS